MGNIGVLIRKEFLEQLRTKKILIICVIFIFIAVASPILAKVTPELLKNISVPGLSINLPAPTYIDALDQFIKNISQIALLVLVFVVAGAVSDEKSRKTLEIVMSKPISRSKFIFSKFASIFISVSTIFLLASGLFYAYSVSVFSTFNLINFVLMTVIVLLYILMIIAITILASTIVKNSIVAGSIGFISFVVFGSISGLFENINKYSPNFIFSNYQNVVSGGWNNELIWPIIVTIGFIVMSVIISILVFRHQEIER